jgi:nitroreductase
MTTAQEDTNHLPQMEPFRFQRLSAEEQLRRASSFFQTMSTRRTLRAFSSEPVPFEVIEKAVKAAATAPSGANQQPWRFVVVSNPEVKRQIREAAEVEEREFYHRRAPREWLAALQPLGTDWQKPFLEIAPYLIVIFRLDYGLSRDAEGHETKIKHLLCYGVRRNCGGLIAYRAAPRWSGDVNPHAQPDGISEQDSEPAEK